jgi:hypothetical protein
MSILAYAVDWLTAAGLASLAGGTYAQAWSAMREYQNLLTALPNVAKEAIIGNTSGNWAQTLLNQTTKTSLLPGMGSVPLLLFSWRIIRDVPRKLVTISAATTAASSGAAASPAVAGMGLVAVAAVAGAAVRVAELMRTAAVWWLITFGSTLILVAAIIQLVLAYN